jgi:hypothetical protein
MYNPVHPGDFIRTKIIESQGLSVTAAAKVLGVSRPALSNLLNQNADLSGETCRYGGEEFVVILSGTSVADAVARAEVLRETAKHMVVPYAGQVLGKVSLSIGVAGFPAPRRQRRGADPSGRSGAVPGQGRGPGPRRRRLAVHGRGQVRFDPVQVTHLMTSAQSSALVSFAYTCARRACR